MSTIAILGAKGRVGHAVATACLAAGHDVVAVSRTGAAINGLEQAESRGADALDRDSLIRATRGAGIVFNGLNPPYTAWRRQCARLATNVMAAAKAHGALHLFPGNVYNFGTPMPAELRAGLEQNPSSVKGAIRIEMEQIFEREAMANGVRTIILRAGDFFGTAGTGSWFDLVIASKLAGGKFTYPGPMDLKHAWAYLPDLAATFVRLAGTASAGRPFETFHFPGHNVTGAELKAAIGKAVGSGLKTAGLPWPVLRFGGLVVPMWREIAEMRYLWEEAHSMLSSELAERIGPVPHTPLDAAVRNALADLDLLPGVTAATQAAENAASPKTAHRRLVA